MQNRSKPLQHTPGPWTAEKSVKSGFNIRDPWNNIPAIARTYHDGPEGVRDATLIAAAPDMLEALRAVANSDVPMDRALDVVWAAINLVCPSEADK